VENIEQAVERARAREGGGRDKQHGNAGYGQRGVSDFGFAKPEIGTPLQEAVLNSIHLHGNRIISHIISDPRSRSFDMLRTQVLQSMDPKGWRTLAVTSPTPGCGKTVTALNLAISIARQPERSALLVDLDLQRPNVARTLGLNLHNDGVLGVLEGKATLSEVVINARLGDQQLFVVPTVPTPGSSELMASRAMGAMIQNLKRDYNSRTIIIDMPPILTGDDVIAILPQVDCVLLVAAVGSSTVAQIEECGRHLQSVELVRIVVNKVPEASTNYQYYY
jgi:protein-tyrosine kinase